MRHDRPRRPIKVPEPEGSVDHTTVRTLQFPSTQGYAQPPTTTPAGDASSAAGPDPAHVSRFNDYRGE